MNPNETEELSFSAVQSSDLLDSEMRTKYEEARNFYEEKLRPLAKEATASERLTKDDYQIRINAR